VGATNALLLPFPELTETADGPDAFSDLANAIEDWTYDRSLPAGVTRYLPHHWGSGISLPTFAAGARDGDTYRHTGLSCRMKFDGTNWRQDDIATLANVAARNAISAGAYAALLHEDFRVWLSDVDLTYTWNGAAWIFPNEQVADINFFSPARNTAGLQTGRLLRNGRLVQADGLMEVPTAITAGIPLFQAPTTMRPPTVAAFTCQVETGPTVFSTRQFRMATDGNFTCNTNLAASSYVWLQTIAYILAP